METTNQNPQNQTKWNEPTPGNRSGRVMGGLFIIVIGALLLARQTGVYFPHWLFSFPTLIIAIGLYVGFRHSFKGFGWLIPIGIGSVMLANNYYDQNIWTFVWPAIIIVIGLTIMFRPSRNRSKDWQKWHEGNIERTSGDDYIDSVVFFGGVKKNIISKNFRGGEAVTVFGGTEINLTQADVNHNIVLDLTQVFGGTKLIVPPHWKIQSEEVVCLFGGVEDKRPILADPNLVDTSKVLVLKGTCVFGGIDIKSF